MWQWEDLVITKDGKELRGRYRVVDIQNARMIEVQYRDHERHAVLHHSLPHVLARQIILELAELPDH